MRVKRREAKASAAPRHQNGWRRQNAWDTLSCIHGVLAGAQFCTLLALVGGCLETRKVNPSFSGHFCSGRRNKTLTSEVSSIPQVLIECRPRVRKALCLRSNWRITAKWQISVNRMKQDRTIPCVVLRDINLQNTRRALIRKVFQVTVDVWMRWPPPKGTWKKGLCSVTSLALSNARKEDYQV